MLLCQCHPCQLHRIASTGVTGRALERVALRAGYQGLEPEDLIRRLIEMGLNAMDEADDFHRAITGVMRDMMDDRMPGLPGNVVSLAQHRRART